MSEFGILETEAQVDKLKAVSVESKFIVQLF